MDSQPQRPQSPTEPFVRARRLEIEPVVSALLLLALVLSINLWRPANSSNGAPSPAEQATAQSQTPNS